MQSLVQPSLVRAPYLTAEDGAVPAKLHSSPTAKMAMKMGKEDAEPLGKKKAASITRKLPRVDQAAAGGTKLCAEALKPKSAKAPEGVPSSTTTGACLLKV